jgi:hypothetical protein
MTVFGNWTLMVVFASKMEEVTGNWRKIHSEELHDSHAASDIVSVIKLKRMK